jgi:hypothetical protein
MVRRNLCKLVGRLRIRYVSTEISLAVSLNGKEASGFCDIPFGIDSSVGISKSQKSKEEVTQ